MQNLKESWINDGIKQNEKSSQVQMKSLWPVNINISLD